MTELELPQAKTFPYKGKTYTVSPIVVDDLIAEAAYLRDQVVNEAKRQMQGLPKELAQYAWSQARLEAKKILVGTDEFNQASTEFEGAIYMFHLQLKHSHPEIPLALTTEMFLAYRKWENEQVVFTKPQLEAATATT